MAFTVVDALEDIPELLTIVQQIEAGVQGLPKPAKASDYTKLAASVLPSLGVLIDTIEAQVAAGNPPTNPPAK